MVRRQRMLRRSLLMALLSGLLPIQFHRVSHPPTLYRPLISYLKRSRLCAHQLLGRVRVYSIVWYCFYVTPPTFSDLRCYTKPLLSISFILTNFVWLLEAALHSHLLHRLIQSQSNAYSCSLPCLRTALLIFSNAIKLSCTFRFLYCILPYSIHKIRSIGWQNWCRWNFNSSMACWGVNGICRFHSTASLWCNCTSIILNCACYAHTSGKSSSLKNFNPIFNFCDFDYFHVYSFMSLSLPHLMPGPHQPFLRLHHRLWVSLCLCHPHRLQERSFLPQPLPTFEPRKILHSPFHRHPCNNNHL